ncbi:MAG: hypothetical protein EA391_13590 [Balneolaceae bacterium]|nr:MAG: hypothetical protein EA391_13590 [Balneolaceae bacterium]
MAAFFQGINPVLPIIFITGIGAISLFIAWWTYSSLSSIPAHKKGALIGLRAVALFILVLLLLNPFISRLFTDAANQRVAVYLDNSQSITIERGEYDGLNTYGEIIAEFERSKSDEIEFDYFLFDDSITRSDELTGTGVRTNINNVVEHLQENETNYLGAVLFSDGIITQGRNPIFAAQNLSVPIFTVPVGDTTDVRDIAISDVEYSSITYSFTSQTIRAEIQQTGYEGESATVQFMKSGELIESQEIDFTTAVSSHIAEFSLEFNEPGFFDFEINVPPKEDELTDQNNRYIFNIEVLDDKTKILSIAYEVHPDVSAIRRFIATDQQNELVISTWINEQTMIGVDPLNLSEEPDLIVLHGLPPNGSNVLEWIENQQIPVLYFATPSAFSRLGDSSLSNIIGFYATGIQNPIDVQIYHGSGQGSHSLLELTPQNYQRFPMLQTFRGNYRLSPLAQPLMFALFQRSETDIPLLIAEDTSTRRKAAVNAFGWYRYQQSTLDEAQQFYTQFLSNLFSWASTPPDRRTLMLEPAKPSFTENESVEIRAELFNELGEPEPEAFVDIEIFSGDNPEPLNRFRMNHLRNEIYTAELGNFPQGLYRIEGRAVKNDHEIGTAETRVNVSQSSTEFLNTKRNDDLLISLTEITGGLFISDGDYSGMNEMITRRIAEAELTDTREETFFLYQSIIWFFVVLTLLSVEWLLRRSVSLP